MGFLKGNGLPRIFVQKEFFQKLVIKRMTGFVDDEGPGLPQDATAERLFALFAKGKDERSGKAGLGLYFCKITVERWGGAIGCENRPSLGARFWFRLPRVVAPSV